MEQYYSLIGVVALGIVNLGLFATKADVEKLRSEVTKDFMAKREVERLYEKLDKLTDLVHMVLWKMGLDSNGNEGVK